jgi:MFS family permease
MLVVNKLGNRKSLILGNLFVASSILAVILANNIAVLIFSNFLSAFGYALKGLTETSILFDSIEKNEKRNDIFSKIDGKSSSFYYYIDAITSLTTGYLFVINGYLPMTLCFIICIISLLISYSFKEVEEPNKNNHTQSIQTTLTDTRDRF